MATVNKNLSDYNFEEVPSAKGMKIGIAVAEWNTKITEGLFDGAKKALLACGCKEEDIVRKNVPGSFELIYGAKKAQSYNPDAVIVIGSVIQGQTKHFDFVCQAVSQGVKDLNVLSKVPVVFCVLTDNTLEQAQDRSGGKHGNKGVEAAVAAMQMIALRKVP